MDPKNNDQSNQNSLTRNLDHIATKSQETMNTIKQEGERYVEAAKEQWEDLKEQAQDKGEEIQEQWDTTRKTADRYARQNPWQVAGLAAALGAIAALLLTSCRRRNRD